MLIDVIAKRPRQVGICLKHLPSDTSQHFHSGNVPWQRVISSKGMISHRYVDEMLSKFHDADFCRGPGSAERQAEALRQEGVQVDVDSMGDFYVDFARYGWFPERLPGEESEDSEDEGDAQ